MREKLIQAMTKKFMTKKLRGSIASFSLLGDTMLSQPNLIRAKGRTLSLLNPHQNLHLKFNLPWEMRDPKKD